MLDALAFVVCNVAARPPLRMLADMRRAFDDPRELFAGAASAVVGAVFLLAAGFLVAPALPDPGRDFGPIELATVLVGLALDALVGEELRGLAGSRHGA